MHSFPITVWVNSGENLYCFFIHARQQHLFECRLGWLNTVTGKNTRGVVRNVKKQKSRAATNDYFHYQFILFQLTDL